MITTTGHSNFRKRKSLRRRAGFTLIEMLIAISIGGIVLAAATGSLVFLVRGSAGLANYHDMNLRSRLMLDKFASDSRMSENVNSATSTSVSLEVYNSSGGLDTVVYAFNSVAGTFKRTVYPGGDVTKGYEDVILENVTTLNFTYYTLLRTTLSEPVTLISIKEIQLDALMKLHALETVNTNQIISARYMMRNKKVSS